MVENSTLGEGISGEIYNDMMYMEVARSASKGKGIGIAQVLINQLQAQDDISRQNIKGAGELTDK